MPMIGGGPAVRGAMYGGENWSVQVDTSGLDNLASLGDEMAERAIRYAAVRGAAKARQNIRAVHAIDTGFMVNTTRARQLGRFLWSIGTAAFYGIFIEMGTVRMGARPWLAPAFADAVHLLEQIIRSALPPLAGGNINVPSGGGD